MIPRQLLYLLTLLLLTSCDCFTVVKGKIISSETKLPIRNATVELIGKNTTVKSDDKGQFKIEYVSGFCFDPKIRVTSESYKPFEIKIHHSNDSKSYELKSDTKFIEYDKPFYPNPAKDSGFITGTWIENYSQSFAVYDDSLLIYLDNNNVQKEIENIQKTIKENY